MEGVKQDLGGKTANADIIIVTYCTNKEKRKTATICEKES